MSDDSEIEIIQSRGDADLSELFADAVEPADEPDPEPDPARDDAPDPNPVDCLSDDDLIALIVESSRIKPAPRGKGPYKLPRKPITAGERQAVRIDIAAVRAAQDLAIRLYAATGDETWARQPNAISAMLMTAVAMWSRYADLADERAAREHFQLDARGAARHVSQHR